MACVIPQQNDDDLIDCDLYCLCQQWHNYTRASVTCGIVCITVIKTWFCDAAYSPGVKITRSWHITMVITIHMMTWYSPCHQTALIVESSLQLSVNVTWCLQREMFTVPGSDRDWVLGTAGLRRLGAGSQGSLLHCITPWLPPLAAIIAGLLHINHRNGKMQGKSRANKHWHLNVSHISRWSL